MQKFIFKTAKFREVFNKIPEPVVYLYAQEEVTALNPYLHLEALPSQPPVLPKKGGNPLGEKLAEVVRQKITAQLTGGFAWAKAPKKAEEQLLKVFLRVSQGTVVLPLVAPISRWSAQNKEQYAAAFNAYLKEQKTNPYTLQVTLPDGTNYVLSSAKQTYTGQELADFLTESLSTEKPSPRKTLATPVVPHNFESPLAPTQERDLSFEPAQGNYQDLLFGLTNAPTPSPYSDQMPRFFPNMDSEDWKELCMALLCINVAPFARDLPGQADINKAANAIAKLEHKLMGKVGDNLFNFYQYLLEEHLGKALASIPDLAALKEALISDDFLQEYNACVNQGVEQGTIEWFWFHVWLLIVLKKGSDEDIGEVGAAINGKIALPEGKISGGVRMHTWRSYQGWLVFDHIFNLQVMPKAMQAIGKVTQVVSKRLATEGKNSHLIPNVLVRLLVGEKVMGIAPEENTAPLRKYYTTQTSFEPAEVSSRGLRVFKALMSTVIGVFTKASDLWPIKSISSLALPERVTK
ncbi:hypothetical protein [Microscilla marina]|uniref:Uncharacterized protein n=1 Tax=Microscilla marina ATCC 23134 TaxID=313606 RepID=A1ZUL9_MICM2|nr:hypothetical protein [Microscilla marina]EAY25905.1 hypothetical protein M23134_00859 [Microscilla marina ATCC 23134]